MVGSGVLPPAEVTTLAEAKRIKTIGVNKVNKVVIEVGEQEVGSGKTLIHQATRTQL